MKNAKKQAKKIPADKRAEEIQKNFLASTDRITKSREELDKKITEAHDTIWKTVEAAGPEHQQALSNVALKANNLLAQLKAGADVNDIVKQLKNLQP